MDTEDYASKYGFTTRAQDAAAQEDRRRDEQAEFAVLIVEADRLITAVLHDYAAAKGHADGVVRRDDYDSALRKIAWGVLGTGTEVRYEWYHQPSPTGRFCSTNSDVASVLARLLDRPVIWPARTSDPVE